MASLSVSGGSTPFTSIQAAIDAASDGDTIVVFEGVYEEDLIINKAVTIVGAQHGNEGTDGDRSPEFGFQETTIKGNCDITAAGAVTIDGIRFLNNGGGPSNPTLHIFSAADHVITNCIFYSEGAGAATDDRAISISPAATGEFTISDCYFTGASEGLFSDASWGRAIWFDGGGADLTVTGNTIEFSRTALNLDMSGTSEATIENNTLRSDGSGISVGFNSDGLSVSDNSFQNVGTDFNFRNLTTDTTFDAATAIGNLIPAVPANPGNDAVLILGGAGEDTLSGTSGVDVIDGNNIPLGLNTDADTLEGRGGNDFLFGRGGIDTAKYSGAITTADLTAVADADPIAGGPQPGWQVAAGAEGTDSITGIEVIESAAGNILLVGSGGFATIQEAIDAASDGDTILIAAGTYNENLTITKELTIVGSGDDTIIQGTFETDNGIVGDVSEFLHTAPPGFDTSAGTGINISASNVTIKSLAIDSFNSAINMSGGVGTISNITIEDVDISNSITGIRKADGKAVTNLDILGGSITGSYIGIYLSNGTPVLPGDVQHATDVTVDGMTFTDLTEKGIYAETLQGTTLFTDLTMTNVGVLGRGVSFGGTHGGFGNGIDVNLKFGVYVGTITIEDFDFNDVGSSNTVDATGHAFGAAIAIKGRDDPPTYSLNPADVSDLSVIVQDGSIDGTSTGVRLGEPAKANSGLNVTGPNVTVTNVAILNNLENAKHADIDNVSKSTLTVNLTGGADTIVAAATLTSTGAIVINALAGADTVLTSAGDDTVSGGAGDDDLDGSAGTDTAVYSGSWADYTITGAGTDFELEDRRGGAPDGHDETENFENFQFSNGTFAAATVLNVDPTDIGLAGTSVAENSANGAVVGDLSGTDADTSRGDVLAFTLLDNAGGRFAVAGTQLVVANGSLLDFEATASHQVTVRVTDLAGATHDETFTISVGDVAGIEVNDDNTGHTINGTLEADTLRGLGGNDTINALGGNDLLVGGEGKDRLTGGAGADTFRFTGPFETKAPNNDLIVDFQHGLDKVLLTPMDANTLVSGNQAFTFAAAFNGNAGQLITTRTATGVLVSGDVNGDKAADFTIAFHGAGLTLTQSDFIL